CIRGDQVQHALRALASREEKDMWLFLIFVTVPIVEIALFIEIGGWLGLFPTLAVVVLTAMAGTALVRQQGLATLARLQHSLSRGEDPVGHIAHGALILVAGVLLLTPGFFTDALGIAFLIPAIRQALIAWGAARLAARVHVWAGGTAHGPRHDTAGAIDGEFEILDEDTARPRRGNSGWTRDR
ncbi:MAG: FxsA family protein, partial [Paracoccaceae bacterium]